MKIIEFLKAKTLFDAFSAWQSAETYPSLQAEAAQPLIDAARAHGSFFTDDPIKTICFPLDALNAMILDAEIDDDQTLADDLRRDKARVTVHVARRIAESLTGKTTHIARQLRASVKLDRCPFQVFGVGEKNETRRCTLRAGHGNDHAWEGEGNPPRSFPSDHDLKARPPVVAISTSQVIPLNGKAAT